MTAAVIVGVDLSLTGTGVAYPDGSTALLKPPKSHAAGMARLAWIRDEVWSATSVPFSMRTVDLVVVEGYSFNSRQGGEHLGELGGVVRLYLFEMGIPYVDVSPAALKKFATGKGNAPKDAVLSAAVRAGFDGDNNNEADAWWLRSMGLYVSGAADVTVTAYRDEAVAKIEWPTFVRAGAA